MLAVPSWFCLWLVNSIINKNTPTCGGGRMYLPSPHGLDTNSSGSPLPCWHHASLLFLLGGATMSWASQLPKVWGKADWQLGDWRPLERRGHRLGGQCDSTERRDSWDLTWPQREGARETCWLLKLLVSSSCPYLDF